MVDFSFATCLPGLEPAVKRDIARVRPSLRLSYSRPGLLTFKSEETIASDEPSPSPFARLWGRSLGSAATPEDAARIVQASGAVRLHVFARDPEAELERPGPAGVRSASDALEESPTRDEGVQSGIDLAPWRDAIESQLALPAGPAHDGELVADVIVAPNESAWIGTHRASRDIPPYPGAAIPVAIPSDAPSRAYSKIEEAIAWAALPIAAGHVALEIGCSPGGAMLALARRGLEVWGVDTADVAPQVLAEPNVHHMRQKVGALRWEDLPPRIDWLLLDVNLAPQVALHEVARLMPRLRATLRGAVFTLKLNEWSFVDALPSLVDRMRAMGFADVRLRHLPSNRRELAAVALP